MEKALGIVWDVMNSPAGITAMAGVFLWLLNRLYAKKPLWKRFEGSIISAVRFAEKEIPDDTPGKSLARLDAAPSISGGRLLTGREALRIATRGSAAVLGRDDVGSLEVGKAADFIAISLDRIEYAGSLHDPVAAVLFVAPVQVDVSYVHGRSVVKDGELVGVELPSLIEKHNQAAKRLVG